MLVRLQVRPRLRLLMPPHCMQPPTLPAFQLAIGNRRPIILPHFHWTISAHPVPVTTYTRADPDGNGNGTSTTTKTFANVFNGMATANGVWHMYITSAAGGGAAGSIASWTLNLITAGVGTPTTSALTRHTPSPSFTSSSSVTLTAQVTPARGGPVNIGNVLFHDNGIAGGAGAGDLGTAAVDASGVATLGGVQFT